MISDNRHDSILIRIRRKIPLEAKLAGNDKLIRALLLTEQESKDDKLLEEEKHD